MDTTERIIADLQCTVVDTNGCGDGFRAAVVMCHGFGAPGRDLVPVAAELVRAKPGGLDGVRFIFPMAPIQLDPGGFYDSRAWWPIDMIRLQQMLEQGSLRDLRRDRPALLDTRYAQLSDLLDEMCRETGLTHSQIIVGGFSQGAMLATEFALRYDPPPGGLIVWSGTLLSEDRWKEMAPTRAGMPVVQTHGRTDPILPFSGTRQLQALLVESGLNVEFAEFNGPHTIPPAGIEMAAGMIAAVAAP